MTTECRGPNATPPAVKEPEVRFASPSPLLRSRICKHSGETDPNACEVGYEKLATNLQNRHLVVHCSSLVVARASSLHRRCYIPQPRVAPAHPGKRSATFSLYTEGVTSRELM